MSKMTLSSAYETNGQQTTHQVGHNLREGFSGAGAEAGPSYGLREAGNHSCAPGAPWLSALVPLPNGGSAGWSPSKARWSCRAEKQTPESGAGSGGWNLQGKAQGRRGFGMVSLESWTEDWAVFRGKAGKTT